MHVRALAARSCASSPPPIETTLPGDPRPRLSDSFSPILVRHTFSADPVVQERTRPRDMSAGADATPPPVGDRASPDKRPSGFTAVNRSPSNSSAHGNEAGSNGRPDGQDAEADMTSGKRKQPEAVSNTQKRARLSPSAPPAGTYERSNGQANGAAPQRPADDSSWPDHNRNGSTTSDAQLAEVLTSNMSGHAAAPGVSSPEAYQGHNVQGEAAYTQAVDGKYSLPPGTTAQQLQRGSGLRKRSAAPSDPREHRIDDTRRNFSNRTKTGCLTCRERKKKCDERKPHCANCERGGFICKGYSTNGSYKGNVGSQLPLQPSQHGYPPQYGYQPHVPAAYYDQNAPPPPGQPPHPQDPHARSQGYPNPQWTGAALPHYPQDPLQRQEYQPIAAHPQAVMSQPPMGALPEMQRQHPSKMPPPPEPVHPPHNRSNSTHSAYGAYGSHPLPNGQPFQYSSQRVTAQLALDHASTTREPATEKGKMLAAFPYNQRDPELKQDRYECAQRVYRFNKNAGEPGTFWAFLRRLRRVSSPLSSPTLGHTEVRHPDSADWNDRSPWGIITTGPAPSNHRAAGQRQPRQPQVLVTSFREAARPPWQRRRGGSPLLLRIRLQHHHQGRRGNRAKLPHHGRVERGDWRTHHHRPRRQDPHHRRPPRQPPTPRPEADAKSAEDQDWKGRLHRCGRHHPAGSNHCRRSDDWRGHDRSSCEYFLNPTADTAVRFLVPDFCVRASRMSRGPTPSSTTWTSGSRRTPGPTSTNNTSTSSCSRRTRGEVDDLLSLPSHILPWKALYFYNVGDDTARKYFGLPGGGRSHDF